MAKDLTVSRIDRQNILNNDLAVQEIQEKSGIQGILWENKIYITREDVATFLKLIFGQSADILSKITRN